MHEHEWPGKTVVHHSYSSQGIYLIERGYVKSQDTRGVICGLMCEPESFGATALKEPSPISITTVTMCQFMLLPADQFEAVLADASSRTRCAPPECR
eukprot:985811-Prymnesium_polylepis.1